ncbi:MAG TPA: tRNA (adenosine(37)-N6)-dimethylallyltransferase MiaA [Pseudolabrys sp.]|nr:tRNA (adenosine(37)-N6)-dimethylallyltransferase MiaA [Pseudolabrys sp.]
MTIVRAVLIAGPTASGKSALALAVAESLGGVIVNADSMQVYRDLRVITARPTADDEARAPHKLYGFVDAAESYSVGRWCRDVEEALAEIGKQGRVPILVGGTGLYFKALMSGLAAVPPIPADIRAGVRGRLQHESAPTLHAELMRLDPATAQRITANDRSRISRALEVVLATGRALSDWHREGLPPLIDPARAAKVFITCERKELVRRIEARFDTMMRSTVLEEVRRLAERKLDPALPAMKAHGVPWLIRHLNGEISREDAIAGAVMDTRRYAKRQLTWFRNQMKDWVWAEPKEALSAIQSHFPARF